MALARKVNVTFILMKTVIFILRGRHEGIAGGQTGADKEKQGQSWIDGDRQ